MLQFKASVDQHCHQGVIVWSGNVHTLLWEQWTEQSANITLGHFMLQYTENRNYQARYTAEMFWLSVKGCGEFLLFAVTKTFVLLLQKTLLVLNLFTYSMAFVTISVPGIFWYQPLSSEKHLKLTKPSRKEFRISSRFPKYLKFLTSNYK